jgi:Flp pilus assembly pilin Flp
MAKVKESRPHAATLELFPASIGRKPDSNASPPVITFIQRRGTCRGPLRERRQRNMKNLILKLQVWKDKRGQDLIEYALMAGFVAVAAGAIMPGVANSISIIFSKIASVMTGAASQGS